MKITLKMASVFLLAMLIFVPLQSAAAKGTTFDGRVIFGQSYTLKSGETLNGDLLVFGGSATIEAGATVIGNTVVFGGSLVVNGQVTGDVAVTGGSITIGSSAHIHGNLATVGASLDRADGSQIDGQIYNTATSWVGSGINGQNPLPPVVTPPAPVVPRINFNFNPFLAVVNAAADGGWAGPADPHRVPLCPGPSGHHPDSHPCGCCGCGRPGRGGHLRLDRHRI